MHLGRWNFPMLVCARSIATWCLTGVAESSSLSIKHLKNIGIITCILCSDVNIKILIRTYDFSKMNENLGIIVTFLYLTYWPPLRTFNKMRPETSRRKTILSNFRPMFTFMGHVHWWVFCTEEKDYIYLLQASNIYPTGTALVNHVQP